MKTSELIGAALDWAVAKCEGATNLRHDTVATWWFTLNGEDRALSRGWSTKQNFAPSTDWSQGGLIIERESVSLETWHGAWQAELEFLPDDDTHYRYGKGAGPTPLIAAMRCYVASKLGDTVQTPQELTA
jgi:hypothetical protein